MKCLFCSIIEGKIPSTKVFESDKVLGFVDIHPQAKKHWLFLHKHHDQNVLEMVRTNPMHVSEVYQAMAEFAAKEGIEKTGLRIVTNLGEHGGQTVFHTHFHLLAGEALSSFGA